MAEPIEGRAALGHLVRRAAFSFHGASEAFTAETTYAQAVEHLLGGLLEPAAALPEGFDAYRPGAIQHAWFARLLAGPASLAERLTFFWHGQFATSQAKVTDGPLLWRQLELLRAHGAGRFEDLLLAVSRDVAMSGPEVGANARRVGAVGCAHADANDSAHRGPGRGRLLDGAARSAHG